MDYINIPNYNIGSVLTGKKFNEYFKNKYLVKLTTQTENHNGFQFKTGLNIDENKFN